MPIIDFKELASAKGSSPAGEDFEGLVRELGKQLGFKPEWSGRGADHGRDLLFTERRKGALGANELQWLVSCKDFATSGRSVTEEAVGSVSDKVRQHGATGFLLATTTTASSGLKTMLDGLRQTGEIETLVWDRHELEDFLLRDENADLVKRYFPKSYVALQRLSGIPQALDSLRALMPNAIYDRIANVVETYVADETWITGELIWPYDRQSAETIDQALIELLEKGDPIEAASILCDDQIEFDAFEATLATLSKLRPAQCAELCRQIVKIGNANGSSLFAFNFYVDNYEPANEEQISLAVALPNEDLHGLYADEISAFLNEDIAADPAGYQAWSDLDALSSHTTVSEVYTDNVDLKAHSVQSRIDFRAVITIAVELEYDREQGGSLSFPGQAEGYMDAQGIHVEVVTVDTTSFYR